MTSQLSNFSRQTMRNAGLPAPNVMIIDNIPTTTSLDVAEYFGKQHNKVLKVIRNSGCSEKFSQANFGLAEYKDAQGKSRPMYKITKDGFIFVVMGFTGEKASRMKEAYILKFNEMSEKLEFHGLLHNFDPEGALPNNLEATGKILAQVESRIQTGQGYMRTLRRTKKRCVQHIADLSTGLLPEPPDDFESN